MPQDDQRGRTIEPEHIVPANVKDIAIQSIPEKFYGAALSARIAEVKKAGKDAPQKPAASAAAGTPKKRRSLVPIIIIVVLLLAGVGGGFVYFNRQLLFPAPAPAPATTEPPKPAAPPPVSAAPTDLAATTTSATLVQLSWTDASNNEAGFRIERRMPATEYAPVTSLPPNSSAYQDSSVQPSTSYLYRVIALNEGGDSPPSNEVPVTTPAPPPAPPEAPKLPPAGLDSDSDGLTDLEEPIYGANPLDPDTDHDTFLDGNEVFHLYNPASGKNAKLLESNLVKVVESPIGWRMYVPISWKVDISSDGMMGTISTGHGETFTLTVQDNPTKEKIMDWYLERHPGTLSSQVTPKTTKSGVEGLVGIDPLVTYFPWGDKVLVFTYDLDGQTFVNFRTTYEMMQNSLSLSVLPLGAAAVPSPTPTPTPTPSPSPSPSPTPSPTPTPTPTPSPSPEPTPSPSPAPPPAPTLTPPSMPTPSPTPAPTPTPTPTPTPPASPVLPTPPPPTSP